MYYYQIVHFWIVQCQDRGLNNTNYITHSTLHTVGFLDYNIVLILYNIAFILYNIAHALRVTTLVCYVLILSVMTLNEKTYQSETTRARSS